MRMNVTISFIAIAVNCPTINYGDEEVCSLIGGYGLFNYYYYSL